MRDFRGVKVWERAHALTLAMYKATASFPRDEQYGRTSQIRRACASIPANIAEGCGRSGAAGLGQFLLVAMGSARELDYHLLLARDLAYLNTADYDALALVLNEVKRMRSSLVVRVRTDRDAASRRHNGRTSSRP